MRSICLMNWTVCFFKARATLHIIQDATISWHSPYSLPRQKYLLLQRTAVQQSFVATLALSRQLCCADMQLKVLTQQVGYKNNADTVGMHKLMHTACKDALGIVTRSGQLTNTHSSRSSGNHFNKLQMGVLAHESRRARMPPPEIFGHRQIAPFCPHANKQASNRSQRMIDHRKLSKVGRNSCYENADVYNMNTTRTRTQMLNVEWKVHNGHSTRPHARQIALPYFTIMSCLKSLSQLGVYF